MDELAQSYDHRFRREIERALREADDPNIRRIPNEEVEADWHRRRAELIARLRWASRPPS